MSHCTISVLCTRLTPVLSDSAGLELESLLWLWTPLTLWCSASAFIEIPVASSHFGAFSSDLYQFYFSSSSCIPTPSLSLECFPSSFLILFPCSVHPSLLSSPCPLLPATHILSLNAGRINPARSTMSASPDRCTKACSGDKRPSWCSLSGILRDSEGKHLPTLLLARPLEPHHRILPREAEKKSGETGKSPSPSWQPASLFCSSFFFFFYRKQLQLRWLKWQVKEGWPASWERILHSLLLACKEKDKQKEESVPLVLCLIQ